MHSVFQITFCSSQCFSGWIGDQIAGTKAPISEPETGVRDFRGEGIWMMNDSGGLGMNGICLTPTLSSVAGWTIFGIASSSHFSDWPQHLLHSTLLLLSDWTDSGKKQLQLKSWLRGLCHEFLVDFMLKINSGQSFTKSADNVKNMKI